MGWRLTRTTRAVLAGVTGLAVWAAAHVLLFERQLRPSDYVVAGFMTTGIALIVYWLAGDQNVDVDDRS